MQSGKALIDLNDTPQEGSVLFSKSNFRSTDYRNFPLSRIQTRERIRQRVQQAIKHERECARQQAESRRASCLKSSAEAEEERRPMQLPTAQAVQHASTQVAEPVAPRATLGIVSQTAQQAVSAVHTMPSSPPVIPVAPAPPIRQREDQQPFRFIRQDTTSYARYTVASPEDSWRPAWLAAELAQTEVDASLIPQAPADTLQGARERLTARWFALKGAFEGVSAPEASSSAPAAAPASVLAVFSLAGGVGKTSMVANLGRALSARGERVLLVETAAYGLLPFFFGARDQRPGVLRTFSPPSSSSDAPVQMVTIDSDTLASPEVAHEPLSAEIAECARNTNRVIVDIATASAATVRRVLHMSPLVIVPVVPDMNSVVSTGSIDSFFQRCSDVSGRSAQLYFVLNQFDSSLPLHLDVREVLQERLGDRLLPFALRRAPAVSEALAEGMTVMDYAPNSPVSEDFNSLAAWIRNLSASAEAPRRGLRWSEK